MSRSVSYALALALAILLLIGLAIPSRAHAPGPDAADQPGQHGMFMVGEDSLFLLHTPMFTMEKHMYQVVLRASLPDEQMAGYRKLRTENSGTAYNLINVADDQFTLPEIKAGGVRQFKATIYDGYSNAGGGTPGAVLWGNVPVTIEDVVIFRHFNFSIERPANLNYVIFGQGDEAHLTHYIARDPSFQHILTLPAPPDWLSVAELAAGVVVEFPDLPSEPVSCTEPLSATTHPVSFEGRRDKPHTLDLSGAQTVWYSTGNLLNAKDPCPE